MKTTKLETWRRRGQIGEHLRLLLLTPRGDTPEKKAARLARCLRRQEEILRRHYKASPQYAEREYVQKYAAKYTAKLLQERLQIRKQYLKFSRRRALVEHLESHAPELLAWVRWQIAALCGGERGIVCQMHIVQESSLHLKKVGHPLTRAIRTALLPLLDHLPAVTLALQWDEASKAWVSTIVKGGIQNEKKGEASP